MYNEYYEWFATGKFSLKLKHDNTLKQLMVRARYACIQCFKTSKITLALNSVTSLGDILPLWGTSDNFLHNQFSTNQAVSTGVSVVGILRFQMRFDVNVLDFPMKLFPKIWRFFSQSFGHTGSKMRY